MGECGMDLLSKERHYTIEEMIDFISDCDEIYLYGAGKIAKRIARLLQGKNVSWTAFLVTDLSNCDKELMGHPVYSVDQIKMRENDGIILAVAEKTQAQLLQYLDTLECPARIYEQRIYSRYYVVPENYLRGADKEKGFFAKFQTLNSLGEYFGTDKCNKGHDYLRKYELFLQYWKDKKFTLLELGVFRGESLFTWGGSGDREGYFNEARIIGVDINPDCCQYAGRKEVIIKDLGKREDLMELKSLRPSIILDDASHLCTHQLMALLTLWDIIPSGGIYILEDIDTSFENMGYHGFDDAIISTYDFCKGVAECVTSGGGLRNKVPLYEKIEIIASQVDMISFIHGSCIMIKK